MGKIRRGVVRHYLLRVLEGDKKRRVIKLGESLRDDYSNKQCYYCKKKGQTQMKEDLKRMEDIRIGRRDGESSRDAVLGFVDDDDYDGALLVDGGVTHSKEWVINYGYSFHIYCENKNLLSLDMLMESLSICQMMKG